MSEPLNNREQTGYAHGSLTETLPALDHLLNMAAFWWLVRECRWPAGDGRMPLPEAQALIEEHYPGGWDRFVLGRDAETEHALPAIEWREGREPSLIDPNLPNVCWTANPGTVEAPHGYRITCTRVGYLVRGYDPVDDRWRSFEDTAFEGPSGSGFYPTFEAAEAAVRLYDHHLTHSERGTACTLTPEPAGAPT